MRSKHVEMSSLKPVIGIWWATALCSVASRSSTSADGSRPRVAPKTRALRDPHDPHDGPQRSMVRHRQAKCSNHVSDKSAHCLGVHPSAPAAVAATCRQRRRKACAERSGNGASWRCAAVHAATCGGGAPPASGSGSWKTFFKAPASRSVVAGVRREAFG